MDIRLDRVHIDVAGESMPGAMLMPARELPGVLFVHGWGGSQIQDLSRARDVAGLGCVCVTFDLRGHGTREISTTVSRAQNFADLVAVRGDFDALASVGMPVLAAAALAKALHYDAAVAVAYPGFYASRRNYDVVHGQDADGLPRIGVLEQSWRIGGASAAELLALRAFAADPHLACIRVATHEAYGRPVPPAGATVYFEDDTGRFGGLVKYATARTDGYPA